VLVPTLFQSSAKKVQKPTIKPLVHKTRMGPLTAFALNPAGVRFETQETEEQVVLFLRQHLIVNLGWVVLAIIMAIAPTVLFPMLISALGIVVPVPTGYIVIGTLFWYLGTFGFVLAKFLGWFFNIYIVTNERIVDIDFYYLLYKRFSQAELDKIQDLSYSSGGLIATFFNYGNVRVQTAGETPNLEFDKVPYPEKVVETIRELTEGNS
jgi:uncharacterized membrane protein YdbT with pleckstrin-like domain